MAVSTDIFQSWRRPRVVMRRLLDMGQREDRALAFLMAGSFIAFVSQWPRLSREAHLTGTDMGEGIGPLLVGTMIVGPLFYYLVAIALWGGMRAFGLQVPAFRVRLALFWSILASAPAMLLYGLVRGFIGQGPEATLVGVVWALGFLFILIQSLREAATE
ncbi:hypothetical protein EU803_13465 [Loktanella sp. IMCC34160]|uniref:hypothetical protein n=1 Tax=Loktanella sp. IMCC34160 TaxID=2510646 RepID=UPI00101CDDAE|nr:hypothetical protein [Loktanella sp. IMCC34160]RYG90988.1 hypothetical protein EU803_13465 [Loktanella sp. IMCC34160]